jgi:hypothetical protein
MEAGKKRKKKKRKKKIGGENTKPRPTAAGAPIAEAENAAGKDNRQQASTPGFAGFRVSGFRVL